MFRESEEVKQIPHLVQKPGLEWKPVHCHCEPTALILN